MPWFEHVIVNKLHQFNDLSSPLNVSGFVSLKNGYLFLYNLVQFLGFSWIFFNMTVRLFIFGRGKDTHWCYKSL